MNVNFFNEENSNMQYQRISSKPPKKYGCFGFLFDVFMVFITGGLWLIWIFVREMRKR